MDINAAACELEFVIGDGSLTLWLRNFGVKARAEFKDIGLRREQWRREQSDEQSAEDQETAAEREIQVEEECNARLRTLNQQHLSRYRLVRDGADVDLGEDWRELIADQGYLDEWNGLQIARECSFRLLVSTRRGADGPGGSGGGPGVAPEGGRPEQ